MNPSFFPRLCSVTILFILLAGCSVRTPATPAGNPEPTSTPALPGDQPPASRGSGSYDLKDVDAMLGALRSYRATLSLHFDGTQDGSASKWDLSYTFQSSQQPFIRLLTVDSPSMAGWMIGEFDGTRYYRESRDQACQAELESTGEQESIVFPVNFLPRVWGAEETSVEQDVNGVLAKQYRFNENALGLKGLGTATGELWVASDGGFLVKYSLQAEGGEDFFAAPMQGKMAWEYELNEVNASAPIEPPEGCPPGWVNVPQLSDISNPVAIPGSLTYETGSDVAGAAAFYQEQMSLSGYQETSVYIDAEYARLQYSLNSQTTTVYIRDGKPTTVQIVLDSKQPTQHVDPTPEPAGQVTPDAPQNVTVAFSRTAAMGRNSVLPSYHLDVHHIQPAWDKQARQMTSTDFILSADIQGTQGADIYLVRSKTVKGQAPQTLEGYLIGEKEYKVVDGKIKDSAATILLEWIKWPTDAMPALGTASIGTTLQGTDSIDGRPVDVLVLDSSTADPELLKAWLAANFLSTLVTSAHGTAWVDQQTGALLKLVLDYEAQALDPQSKAVLGTGSGHLEISVTQIGAVTVQLP